MAIRFERAKDGTLISINPETGEEVGSILTMGDMIKKESPTKVQLERKRMIAEIEKKHLKGQ